MTDGDVTATDGERSAARPADEAADDRDADAEVTPATVREALEEVDDPEIPISVVDLGLIYDVTVDDGAVDIEMTLTSLACPAEDMLREDVEERVRAIPGVETASTEIVWDPPWTVERMTDEGRETLREFGITSI